MMLFSIKDTPLLVAGFFILPMQTAVVFQIVSVIIFVLFYGPIIDQLAIGCPQRDFSIGSALALQPSRVEPLRIIGIYFGAQPAFWL
jgi:hypothetical protein